MIETGFSRLAGIMYILHEMFIEGDVNTLRDDDQLSLLG